ncbi:DUF4352 domain-containing protein [Streptomyces rectiverticillatus]|uniref:DUF4352 domain-containing protein n=1 Tax=Streptomyces rectiverticillatus TaxID=173860 RepID=UPI0015C38BC8|nr:DUF4352 domain-containing protein [Streptomyces rectiverticillatus]QLE70961.1 DUF4352 domain-containing protein [Streptomyces rectiverticillatus]
MAFAAAAAVATAGVACGGSGKVGTGQTITLSGGPSASPSARVAAFGDTYAYRSGLKVTVTKPERFTPSGTSLGHTAGNQPVKFTVTVTNGSKEPLDTAGILVTVESGDKADRAAQIFDSASGVGTPFTGSLEPKASGKATLAFDVPQEGLGRVDVAVRPGFGEEFATVHWAGPAP